MSQAADRDLLALALRTTATLPDASDQGRSLIEADTASAQRAVLELGTLATVSPTGTADGTKFLRDDGSWQAISRTAAVVAGSTVGAATSLPLYVGPVALSPGAPGIPVSSPCRLTSVAISWMASTAPAGNWTLTFKRRTGGGQYSTVSTVSVNT